MRVITGTARGTNLYTLEGEDIRPTTQRVKESEFSAIQFYVEGASVLDLFAGTGQMGIEALSRGAVEAVFVDNDEEAVKIIRKNLERTKISAHSRIVKSDAFKYLTGLRREFDIVFMDPPYRQNLAVRIVKILEPVVADNGIVMCETELQAEMPAEAGRLSLVKEYRYGRIKIWMYRKRTEEDKL